MANKEIKIVISAEDDYSAKLRKFNEAIGGTAGAVNQAAAATMSWTDFLRGRMGPAMKEFGSHGAAITELSKQYKEYKQTGVQSMGAVTGAFNSTIRSTLEWEAAAKKMNAAVAGSIASAGKLAPGLEEAIAPTDKLSREFSKLGNVNEFAAGQLIRLRGILQTMAFGAVIGIVSKFTEEMISQYKATTISKEKIDELNKSVMDQATAWKLLPEPINKVTKATIDLYNAQLLYDQHLERNKGKELERQIELTEKAKKMRQEAMGKVVGPLAASIRETWKTEILEADVTLAELNKKLDDWHELMKLKTVDNVSSISAAAKEALKAPSGTNFLTAFIGTSLSGPAAQKPGFTLGVDFVDGFTAGAKSGFDNLNALDFSMPLAHAYSAAITAAAEDPAIAAAKGKLLALSAEEGRSSLRETAANSEIARIYYEYDQKILAQQDYNTKKLALMVAAGASEAEIEQTYRQMNIEAADKERVFKIQAAGQAFGAASNMMQNLFVATGKHNRTMFELGKGFAIAQTAIDTYQASMAAYKALSGIPIVGPALGAAAAAIIVATGLARVREISSMQPGGGSISSGGSANPPYSGGSPEAYPVPQRLEEPRPTQNITLNIYNPLNGQIADSVAENIVDLLNRNAGNNYKIDARVIQAN